MKLFRFFFLLITLNTAAQKPKDYDILNLNADIDIFPLHQSISGQLVYKVKILKNVDSIVFDAPGIHTEKVKTGCFKTNFKQTDKYLIINKKYKKNKIYKLTIRYTAQPNKALYFVGWQSNGRKQVWTQGQGKNNSHWLPTNDDMNDKFTWLFNITAPSGYTIISNGKKLAAIAQKNTLKTSFKQNLPAPAYLIFIGIGKYSEDRIDTQNKVPVFNYKYSDRQQNDYTYYKSKFIFDFISREIPVAYPWQNYKQIPCRDFLYGGMENVSATSFNGDRYVVDSIDFNDVNFVNVSAHELTHQWFGDLVTGKSSSDHWLHEGFATYYARLVDKAVFGKDYNDYNIYNYDRQIIKAQHTDTIPLHRPNASSLTYYQKGARIVQMLRQKIGDTAYQKIIKTYLTNYRFKNASIKDFQNLVYQTSGHSLNNFYHLWFETTQIPEFVLQQKTDSIIFIKNSANLPVDFLFITKDSIYKLTKNNSFKLSDYQHLKTVIVNPENQKLYDIQFERDPIWVENQILSAPAFIDRYKALTHLQNWSAQRKDTLFEQLIERQEYYPVYQEIISQIKNDLNRKHLGYLKKLFRKSLKTRQQIAVQIDTIPLEIKQSYKNLIKDASYVTKQAVLWHYWANFPNEISELLDQTAHLKGGNDKAFRLTWLSLALITKSYKPTEKQNFANEIIAYSSPDFNMAIRLNAFPLLIQMQLITPEVIDNLLQASLHFNWRMHQPARRYLKQLINIPRYKDIVLKQIKLLPISLQKSFNRILSL